MKTRIALTATLLSITAAMPNIAHAEGCEVIRSNAFLKQAYCPAGTESYQAKEFGMDTCGGDRSCNVWIWTNRKHLPKAMMMTDAEVENAAYVWISGTATLNDCKKTGC